MRRRTTLTMVFSLLLSPVVSRCLAREAGAATRSVRLVDARITVSPGRMTRIAVGLRETKACRLTAGRVTRSLSTAGATSARFSFRVHRGARAGTHRLRIACAPLAPRTVALTVRRAASNRRALPFLVDGFVRGEITRPARARRPGGLPEGNAPPRGDSGAPLPGAPAAPVMPVVAVEQPLPPERARRLAEEAVAGPLDGFAFFHGNGQCTDWAFQKRPDVVLRAETKHYAEWLLAGGSVAGSQYVMLDWDGGNWARNARYAGLRTGRQPRVGALLAAPAGSGPGHVAYVEELYDSGRFRVTEYNFEGGLGVLHERVLDVAELSRESEFVY